jgi:hypothetical protein
MLILGACSQSCSDRFENANEHILDTAQSVYKLRSLDKITDDKVFKYRGQIENAYEFTNNGSALCESNEDDAEASFEKAEDILDAIDDDFSINKISELTEIEGK